MSLADRPHAVRELPRGPCIGAAPPKGGHQPQGVGARERSERDRRRSLAYEVEQAPALRHVGELLVANAGHDECGGAPQAPTQRRQEPQAGLVRPVDVLQDEEEGTRARQALDERRDGLEEAPVVHGTFGGQGRSIGQLGEEARQLGSPSGAEPSEIGSELGPRQSQEVDPRSERQGLVALVALADEDAAAAPCGLRRQLGDEPALADSRLAPHEQ